MNETCISIDKAGRIVLPKEVREELGLNPGDLLRVETQGDQVTLSPNRDKRGFVRRGRAFVFSSGEGDILSNEVVEGIRNSERSLNQSFAKRVSHPKGK